jgi:hypothetical protein
MARHRKNVGSAASAREGKRPDKQPTREHAERLEQRLTDPEWRLLGEYIRKQLGNQATLDTEELLYLVHGRNGMRLPWPMPRRCSVAQLLAVLSRHGPQVARRLLDEMLDARREKRKRPTADRNKLWKRWHDEDKIGPTEIAKRWKAETGQVVEPNAVKQALRRTDRSR